MPRPWKRTNDELYEMDGDWFDEGGEVDEDWAEEASTSRAGRRNPKPKSKAAARAARAPKKTRAAERADDEERAGEDEIPFIPEEVWQHILTGLVSTDGRLFKTCMFRTWAHVAKDIANLGLVCKASSRAVAHDQWKTLETSCLKSIPSVPSAVLTALKIDAVGEASAGGSSNLSASSSAAASYSAAAAAPTQDNRQDNRTAEEKGAKTMEQWMKVRMLCNRLSSDARTSVLKILLGGSGANWFKDFYLTHHASYSKQLELLNGLLLPQPAALPEQPVSTGAPVAVKFEIRREGCRDRSISYGLSDATQTFLLTPKEVQELPHHQEYRSNFAGTEIVPMDLWSQADLVRKALSKRSHEALKAELAAKEKRKQENAEQRNKVKSDTGTSLQVALQRRWAHLPQNYGAFLVAQSKLVRKNQGRCKGKDHSRIEALADYFTKRKGPDNQTMSEEAAMEIVERRAFVMHHDRGQSYGSEIDRVRQRGVNKKSVRLSDQEKAEAAALRALLKQQPGTLESVLALSHLPHHMHAAVSLAWPLRNEEPARPAPAPLPLTYYNHSEYEMYSDDDDPSDCGCGCGCYWG